MSAKVFLDYDQEALDDAYDQAVYAPNRGQILARLASASALARRRLGEPLRRAYGPAGSEKLDLYRTAQPHAPVNVFIHGGAWLRGLARDYAFAAEMFVGAGAHYVAIDFSNVTETGGELAPMAGQVRRAIAWVCRNCASFGGDPARVYISGTSSGAHFGGVAAATDWPKDFGLPRDAVKGYTLCSGMYDLRGPRLSKRSQYVKFTDEVEDALSPQRHLERIVAPIVLVYGSLETPEFQRQSREFAQALRKAGKPVELIAAEGYNHFEIAETLGNPYGPVGRAVMAQMGLTSPADSA
jgi:arylformamidase